MPAGHQTTQPPPRRRKESSLGQKMRAAVCKETAQRPNMDDYLETEIQRNKSCVELNNSLIELNKLKSEWLRLQIDGFKNAVNFN